MHPRLGKDIRQGEVFKISKEKAATIVLNALQLTL